MIDKEFISRKDTFTVECLLPGGWVNGRLINFCVDVLQPSKAENVLLFDTHFWPDRLQAKGTEPLVKLDDMRWRQILKYPVLKVRKSLLTTY